MTARELIDWFFDPCEHGAETLAARYNSAAGILEDAIEKLIEAVRLLDGEGRSRWTNECRDRRDYINLLVAWLDREGYAVEEEEDPPPERRRSPIGHAPRNLEEPASRPDKPEESS